ncbi:hypothetical protein [Capybara microvirus Cap1_SP_106]|nr:hypothetical protein [Capybara microvirus Cap1_SP_106]
MSCNCLKNHNKPYEIPEYKAIKSYSEYIPTSDDRRQFIRLGDSCDCLHYQYNICISGCGSFITYRNSKYYVYNYGWSVDSDIILNSKNWYPVGSYDNLLLARSRWLDMVNVLCSWFDDYKVSFQ